MITRSAGRAWFNPIKSKQCQIKLINENIHHPNWVAFTNLVIKPLGKQSSLLAVNTFNKSLHETLPQKDRRIIPQLTFLHSLDPKQKEKGLD